MKKLLIVLFGIVVLVFVGFVYLGVVPVISPLFARPMDLGVKKDPLLVESLDQSLGLSNQVQNRESKTLADIKYSGAKEVEVVLDSDQISSIIEAWTNYPNSPVSDIQVRVNADGSAEIAGMLKISAAASLAKQLGYSDQEIESARSWAKFVANDIPFYAKASGGVTNNQVEINPAQLKLGQINVPSSILEPASAALADVIERRIAQVPQASVEEVSLANSQVRFVGTVPEVVE